ncbi:MAG: hypothetical protein ABDH91_01385 [Bacteroidia bacterium]
MEKLQNLFLGSLRLLALAAAVGLVACKKKKRNDDPPTSGSNYPPSDGTVRATINGEVISFTYAQTTTYPQYESWQLSGFYETQTGRRILQIEDLPLPSGSDTSYTLQRPPDADPGVVYTDNSSTGNSIYMLVLRSGTQGIYFRVSVNIRGNQAEGTFEGNLIKTSGSGPDTLYVRNGTFSVRLQR